MRLLVLGGTGFIGSHVVDRLLQSGHQVTIVSRGSEPFRPSNERARYLQADYRQTGSLEEALSYSDAVLHSVSSTVPGTGDLRPGADVADNLIPLIGLMEAMQAKGVGRLVYLSSGGTVYGAPETVPIAESHPLRPISSYGIVKVAAESYIDLFVRTRGLSALILRPSNPYGERQGQEGKQGLINTLLHRAVTGEAVEVWGDGSVVRDYLHVEDLAKLCVLAVESGVKGVYNAGSGTGTSVRDLIGEVCNVTGRQLKVRYGPGRSVDAPRSVLDVSAARRDLGWAPEIGLREGLARTWAWHKANQGEN